MITYPNQFTVTVNRDVVEKGYKEPYTAIKLTNDGVDKALLELSPNAFKLYFYFLKNSDGYTFALSSQDIMCRLKMSKPTYTKCRNELEAKGYLESSEGNHLEFHECGKRPSKETLLP